MVKASSYIPKGQHPITPYLVVRGATQALDWYKQALAAEEVSRHLGPEGKLMHAELRIGGAFLYLCDEFPQMDTLSPQTLGNTPVSIHLYVPDVDVVFNRAVAAGARALRPPADMFWGDRFAMLADPFGHKWGIATHKEDLTPEEMERRASEAMGSCGSGQGA
jgi:PhnB protein